MDSCDGPTMTALAMTSRYWNRKRSEVIYYRVVEILKYFQLDPTPFLNFLLESESLISGSAAILAFIPGLFIPGDLDIYCPSEKLEDVLKYLNTETKYKSKPEELSSKEEIVMDIADYEAWEFSESHIAKVLKIYTPKSNQPTEKTVINIIAVKDIRPLTAITHFHSTPVMNIITGKGAICMYPKLTFTMRGLINTNRPNVTASTKFQKCLNKYKERGFDLAMTLGKWAVLKPRMFTKKYVKNVDACFIAFPDVVNGKSRSKKDVLVEEDWWSAWELSQWHSL